ncbi:MAG: dipeptidase PepE [Ferruginibacter sp.]
MKEKNIIAYSSSRVGSQGFLEDARTPIQSCLRAARKIIFIPYAGISIDRVSYTVRLKEALPSLANYIEVINAGNPREHLASADAILVGGGNTFRLLQQLQHHYLIEMIREKINDGCPYIGWSAGSNILSPTICTTNDMPVIQPKNFRALDVYPFQINPHYYNLKPEGFNGESRDDRLLEFLILNPLQKIVGLPEGSCLKLKGENLIVDGKDAVELSLGKDKMLEKKIILAGSTCNYLRFPA